MKRPKIEQPEYNIEIIEGYKMCHYKDYQALEAYADYLEGCNSSFVDVINQCEDEIEELKAEIARHKSYEKELEIEVSDLKGDLGID